MTELTILSIIFIGIIFLAIASFFTKWRKKLYSKPLLKWFRKNNFTKLHSPPIKQNLSEDSPENRLFLGKPDFTSSRRLAFPELTAREQDFIENHVNELCHLVSDWETWEDSDLPQEVMTYLKEHRFFGIGISEEYGGHGFSNIALSEVLLKLSSRSLPLALNVLFSNSLSAARLISHYGSEDQKAFFLPRISEGVDMTCLAASETNSDQEIRAIKSRGVVHKAEGQLKIELSIDKNWVPLASSADIFVVAFYLADPNNFLEGDDLNGVTLALVTADQLKVQSMKEYDLMASPLSISPIRAENISIDLKQVIGGHKGLARGEQMLSNEIAHYKGVGLPSLNAGIAKLSTCIASGRVSLNSEHDDRLSFDHSIKKSLAKVAGLTYLLEASRKSGVAYLDKRNGSASVSALLNSHQHELTSQVLGESIKASGVAGIARGPSHSLAHLYMTMPVLHQISKNLLSHEKDDSFINSLFSHHPSVPPFINAIESNNLNQFDKHFWRFIRHTLSCLLHSFRFSLTRAYDYRVRGNSLTRRYYQKLKWTSVRFAYHTNLAVLFYGPKLLEKRNPAQSLSNLLTWQFLGSSMLHYFEFEGEKKHDRQIFQWAMESCMGEIQLSFEELYNNFKGNIYGLYKRNLALSLIKINPIAKPPTENLERDVFDKLMNDSKSRSRLISGIFQSNDDNDPQSTRERAFQASASSRKVREKIEIAQQQNRLPRDLDEERLLILAHHKNIITQLEKENLRRSDQLKKEALHIDTFAIKQKQRKLEVVPSSNEQEPVPTLSLSL